MDNEPITRQEQLLDAISSGEAANLEPITREEMFLAKLGGADVKIPTPITRKEQFLQKAIEGGGTPGGGGGGSEEEWIGDGNTHIWIHLEEERKTPCLSVCPNGTVTVNWGDGTEPDILTGTSTSTAKTAKHDYAIAGDYVVTLSVTGEMGFNTDSYTCLFSYSGGSTNANKAYQNIVRRIEIGKNIPTITANAFANNQILESIYISDSVTSIASGAFKTCVSLSELFIPNSVTSINYGNLCRECYSLTSVHAPDANANAVVNGYVFENCYSLKTANILNGMTKIPDSMFSGCYTLRNIDIPGSVNEIGNYAFWKCYALTRVIIPGSVTTIGNSAFNSCSGVRYFDFTKHTAVPTLGGTGVFSTIANDCEIRVPAALVDEWKAATNWSNFSKYIVGV